MRISKNIILLGFVSLCNQIASEMVTSVLPAFFTVILRVGAASLGLVEGFADAVANILRIFSGYATDRSVDKKSLIGLGYFLPIIARPLYALSTTVGFMFLPRAIDHMGKGIREVPRDIVIAQTAQPTQIAFSFSIHRAFDTLGAIIGPLIAFFVLKSHPDAYSELFMVAAGIGVGSLIVLLFVRNAQPITDHGLHKKYNTRLDFFRATIGLFLITAGIVPVAVILTQAPTVGIPLSDIPLVYLGYTIMFILTGPLMGWCADRIGKARVLAIGGLIAAVSYLIFTRVHTVEGFILTLAFFGLVPACTEGCIRAFIAEHVIGNSRGMQTAILYTLLGVAAIGAGAGGGLLWQEFGVRSVAVVLGGCVLLGSVLLLIVHDRVTR